jgi:hypothetical protein
VDHPKLLIISFDITVTRALYKEIVMRIGEDEQIPRDIRAD